MKLFFDYLKQRWVMLTLIAFCCAIFCASFALYHLPLAAVLYPASLCLLLGGIAFFCDLTKIVSRHRRLRRIYDRSEELLCELPPADTITERDYAAIIDALRKDLARMQNAADLRYADMIDYYTVWVHQIKTPIASMRLTLQNEDTALSRRLSADLFRIEQYVGMVLAFLRLGSDHTDYLIREYDLDEIIRASVKKFAGEFISRGIRLDYTPSQQSVITDEKWLSFVIEQILSNALKYTAAGTITVCTDGKDLIISDTGTGIPPADLPRIFEKGYTGYNGRTDKRASGLGLWLCKNICDRLGHAIRVSSVPEQSTTVRIGIARENIEHD